jgi:hypothetical protein
VRHHRVVASGFCSANNTRSVREIAQSWRSCAKRTSCKSRAVFTAGQA